MGEILLKCVGDELRRARIKSDYTQEGVADRIGVTRWCIMSIEKGERPTDVITLAKFADLVGASLPWMLRRALDKARQAV